MSKSLTDKTISGLNWNFISNNSAAVINIFVGIVLARILVPKDFGLLGMTYVFIGLAELFVTMGMGASVQRIKELTDDHIRIATTFTILTSISVYIFLWFAAPFVSDFYNEVRIIPILRTLSLIFIVQGLITVSYGIIRRNLDFKYVFKIDLSSKIFGYGLTSTVLALLDFGVWSLVYGKLTASIISAIVIIFKEPLRIKPLFKKKEFKEMVGFGGGVSLSGLFYYSSSNIDLLIIGKILGPSMLGLYTRALNLMNESLTKITGGIYNVLFPAFAAVQDNQQKLRTAYFRAVKSISFIVFPVLTAMIISAEFVIKGLFGSKWGGAVATFQIIGIAGLLKTTLPYSGALAQATGKVYKEAAQQLVFLIILLVGSLFAVKYGIEGVAVVVILGNFWLFVAQSWLVLKITNSKWIDFFRALVPGIGNSVVILIINYLLLYILNSVNNNSMYEVKLLITVVVNGIVLFLTIVFMPRSIKNDTVDWLFMKYERLIPNKFLKFYFSVNKNSNEQ